MSVTPPTDSILKLIETLAPYMFGGTGILAVGLNYFLKKEKAKIVNADKRIALADHLEKLCEEQKDGFQQIVTQCDSADILGQTFETTEITPKQLIFLKTVIDKNRTVAERFVDDYNYNYRKNRNN